MIPHQLPIHASDIHNTLRWNSTLLGGAFWRILEMNNISDDDIYSGQPFQQGIIPYMKLQVRYYRQLTLQVQVIPQFSGRS